MAQAFYPTNDGYVGNLEKLSRLQLQDLIRRQEDLIKKRGFLNKLPDKGQKIKEHLEVLQKELTRRGGTDPKCHVEPHLNGTQATQTVSGLPQDKSDIHVEEGQPVNNSDSLSETTEEQEVGNAGTNSGKDTRSQFNSAIQEQMDLENVLDKLTLSGGINGQVEQTSGKHKHYFDVAEERFEENKRAGIKQPIKLNRALKVEYVKDLPPEILQLKDQIKVAPSHKDHVKHDTEESAAAPPSYKYSTVKTIPLQESLELQQKQKQIQEELNAQVAAEKLASRLNIKLESYNPEGVDMSYRVNRGIDSDDDDDDNVPHVDDSEDKKINLSEASDIEIDDV